MQHVNGQRFFRSSDRILGGVCAGLAEEFHVDALWVRIAFLFLVFLQGLGLFIYVVLWLLVPERLEGGGQRSGFDAMMVDVKRIWGELKQQLGNPTRPAVSPSGGAPTSAPTPTDSPPHSGGPAAARAGWRDPTLLFGVILVIIGLAFLGNSIGIINWSVVWPAGLITLGIVIMVRNLERRP